MWKVTLIAKKILQGENPIEIKESITFVFDNVLNMSNFIDTALKTATDTVEVNIKYLKEGEE
jgi:hypothetical protein